MNKQELLEKVIHKCRSDDAVLLYCTLVGSHAYGNNTDDSDIDIRFVYAASPKHYFGFSKRILYS